MVPFLSDKYRLKDMLEDQNNYYMLKVPEILFCSKGEAVPRGTVATPGISL